MRLFCLAACLRSLPCAVADTVAAAAACISLNFLHAGFMWWCAVLCTRCTRAPHAVMPRSLSDQHARASMLCCACAVGALGLLGLLFPFILLAILVGTGVIDVSAGKP